MFIYGGNNPIANIDPLGTNFIKSAGGWYHSYAEGTHSSLDGVNYQMAYSYSGNFSNPGAYKAGYWMGFSGQVVAELGGIYTAFAGKLFQGGVKAAGYTKSSLQLGQKMHKAYKANKVLKNVRIKEFRLPSGKRVDFIDFENKIIYELKPNNPRQITAGKKQLDTYLKEVESIYGSGWKVVLDLY